MVRETIRILREKFETVHSFGPRRVAEFYNAPTEEERERDARKAFELVQRLLEAVAGP
jgi:HEPN domain-containing protein